MNFSELNKLTEEDKTRIKQRGCVVIRNVVDDAEALQWKQDLVEFAKANPDVEGIEVLLTLRRYFSSLSQVFLKRINSFSSFSEPTTLF